MKGFLGLCLLYTLIAVTVQQNISGTDAPTISPVYNVTFAPTAGPTVGPTVGPTTAAPTTAAPIPVATTPSIFDVAPLKLVFKMTDKTFNVDLLKNTSSDYIVYERQISTQLSNIFVSEITNIRVVAFRPGSIEPTVMFDVYKKQAGDESRSQVIKTLEDKIKLGSIGNLNVDKDNYFIGPPVVDPLCKEPIVTITNLRNTPATAVKVKRSEFYITQSATTLECKDSDTEFKWYAWRLKYDGVKYIVDGPKIVVAVNTSEWTLKKLDLGLGIYLVLYQVTMTKNGVSGYDIKYLSIVQSPLVAQISGGGHVKQGFNKQITLDASPSRDPDLPSGNYTGMSFAWLCKKKGETFPPGSLASIPVIQTSGAKGKGGCFDTGIGKLSSTDRVISINSGLMEVDTSYVVKLIVNKVGKPTANFEQQIDIVNGDPPQLSITCLINCASKMSPSSRLKVISKCSTPLDTCKLDLKYEWSLTRWDVSTSSWKTVPDLSNKLSTSTDSPDAVIKENVLTSGKKYQLTITASDPRITSGTSSYIFETNIAPQSGTCEVNPSTGIALTTDFTFSCKNWQDSDLPLQYQFYYVPEPGLTSVISYGPNSKATTKLPLGKEAGNTMTVYIHIIDSLSAFTKTTKKLTITLDDSLSNDQTKKVLDDSTRQVESLLKSGDVKQATQLANAALDTMSSSKDVLNPTEKAKIIDDIMKQVTSVQPNNLQTLTQITSVIGRATTNPEDVSTSIEDETIKALGGMTTLLAEKSKDSSASEDGLVDAGGENLALCLGNIMKSSSTKAKYSNNDKKNDKSIQVAETSFTLVNKVSESLLQRKVVGEQPSLVQTSSLSLVLSRQTPDDLEDTELKEGENSFVLPSHGVLGPATKKSKFVDSQVTFTKFNPFTWDESAGMIKSHVTSMVLRDDKSEEIVVKDLSKDIAITIAHSSISSDTSNKQQSFLKQGSIRSYRYNIKHPGMAILLNVTVEKQTPVTILVRRGVKPTVSEHDLSSPITNLPACHSTLTEVCKKSENQVFLSAKLLKEQGVYYVGLLWDTSASHSRKKRSCFGHGRQKRSCVEPKEAPSPKNITIIPVYNAKTDINYTLITQQFNCLYWDGEKWTSQGCKAGPNSTATKLQCLCNHLTSFGGSLLIEPNPIDFDKVLEELGRLDETGNVAVLSTILVFFFVYIVIAVVARRADRRDINKYGPPIPVSSRDGGYHYEIIIQTGVWRNSGTTSNVAIVIHGDDATSDQIILSPRLDQSRLMLATGSTDTFMISLPFSFGSLEYLHVRHDNSGPSPSWWLKDIVIKDKQTGESWLFLYQDWLALEKGDGRINKILLPVSHTELRSFNYNFNNRTTKKFTEDHLWLSVVTKSPHSNFTRLQRATCCLTVLFSVMVVNAMFYKTDQTPDPRVQVGPLKFSWRQIQVGIISSLIVFPVGMGTVFLFKNSRMEVRKPGRKGLLGRLRAFFCKCCKGTSKISDSRQCLTSEEIVTTSDLVVNVSTGENTCDGNAVVDLDVINANNPPRRGSSSSVTSQMTKETLLSVNTRSNSKDGLLCSSPEQQEQQQQEQQQQEQQQQQNYQQQSQQQKETYKADESTASLLTNDDQNSEHTNTSSSQSSSTIQPQQNEPNTNNKSITTLRTNDEHQSKKTFKFSWMESIREILTENFSSEDEEGGFSLPHSCIYFSWIICIVTVLVSASFTFIYSLQWGKEIANQWLSSILISFTEDLCVIQPVKIFLVAIFLSCFVRSKEADHYKNKRTPRNLLNTTLNTKTNANNNNSNTINIDNSKPSKLKMKDIEDVELEKAREYQLKEHAMFSFVREMFIYGAFLILLTIVCYGNRSYLGYAQTNTVKNDFNNFTKISTGDKYWMWTQSQFVESVFAGTWYNGASEPIEAYIGNKHSILVGMPRIRQLRIQPDTCTIPKKMRKLFKDCFGEYSITDEDQTRLYLPEWKPFTDTNLAWSNISKLCPKPWRYSTAEELSFLSTWGYHYLYSGGGYVADLGYKSSSASFVNTPLRTNNWIDRRSRALILEFAIFNPSSNQLSVVTLYYEVLPTMFGYPFQKIETMSIYGSESGAYDFFLICKLLFIFFVIFYLAREARRAYKLRKIYFKNLWNWFEILQIVMAACVVICYIVKETMILDAVQKLQVNPFITINFHPAIAWKYAEDVALSIGVFIATVKILRMVRFNPHIIIFNTSLRSARATLLSFSIILFIIMFGFAIAGHLVLGSTMAQYRTLTQSLYTQILLSLGWTIGLTELNDGAYFLGPLMNMSYKMLMAFYFVNFYIAVINDSYEDTRSTTDYNSKEFEMSSFIVDRFMDMFFKSFRKFKNESSIALSDVPEHPSMITLEDDGTGKRMEEESRIVSLAADVKVGKEINESNERINEVVPNTSHDKVGKLMDENSQRSIEVASHALSNGFGKTNKINVKSQEANTISPQGINDFKTEVRFADKDNDIEAQLKEIGQNLREPTSTKIDIISETKQKSETSTTGKGFTHNDHDEFLPAETTSATKVTNTKRSHKDKKDKKKSALKSGSIFSKNLKDVSKTDGILYEEPNYDKIEGKGSQIYQRALNLAKEDTKEESDYLQCICHIWRDLMSKRYATIPAPSTPHLEEQSTTEGPSVTYDNEGYESDERYETYESEDSEEEEDPVWASIDALLKEIALSRKLPIPAHLRFKFSNHLFK